MTANSVRVRGVIINATLKCNSDLWRSGKGEISPVGGRNTDITLVIHPAHPSVLYSVSSE